MSQNIRSFQIGTIFYQSGNGMPIHIATRGCVYIDVDTGTMYINKDGLVNWVLFLESNTIISGDYLPLSGGTVYGPTSFTSGLTANTISATSINTVDYIHFNTGTTTTYNGGDLFWVDSENALSYKPYTLNNDVTVNLGQESLIRVYNGLGYQINNGQVLHITGATIGNVPTVALANASKLGTAFTESLAQTSGVATHDIPNNQYGFMTNFGVVRDINTSTLIQGAEVFLSDTIDGGLTANPDSIAYTSRISTVGYCLKSDATTGSILVVISNENPLQSLTQQQMNVLLGNTISTGVYLYTGTTQGTGSTINISPIRGWIVYNTYDRSIDPLVINVDYSGGTNIPLTNLATSDSTFLLVNSGSTIVQQTTFPTAQQRRQNIFLGKVVHPSRVSITSINNTVDFDVSPMSAIRDIWVPLKIINQGVVISPNGVNMNINSSSGTLWGNGIGWVTNELNPDSITLSGQSPVTFQYRTRLGPITGGTVPTGNTTTIYPDYYDNNGVVTAVGGGSNSSTNQRVYLFPTGLIRIQLGQTVYSSLAAAVAGSQTETFNEYPLNRDNGVLIGIISLNKNASVANGGLVNPNYAVFNFVSKFGEIMGGTGGLSTTTLQQAYDNSSTPEVVTNSTLGALSIKNGTGSADNVTTLLEGINAAGNATSFIRADGAISGTSINTNTLSAITISATTYQNLQISINTSGSTLYSTNPSTSNFSTNNSLYLGLQAGRSATGASYSNFFGLNAGSGATNASYSNFFGADAGLGAAGANTSNFLGFEAGSGANNASTSNFLGNRAGKGAATASGSNFLGFYAGSGATNASQSNFLGRESGFGATQANNSIFIGTRAGSGATLANNSIFLGYQAGSNIVGSPSQNNIIIGNNISLNAGVANRINIGGVLFGSGTYSTSSSNASVSAQTEGRIGINVVDPTHSLHVIGDTRLQGGLTATTISATTFTGNLTGLASSATTASNISITEITNAPIDYNITFVGSVSGNSQLNVDSTTLIYTPSISTFKSPNLSATTTVNSGTKTTTTIDGSNNQSAIVISGSNTVGGAGYVDFIKVTNTSAGATNINKTIRINSIGGLEIINSTYTGDPLFSIADNGIVNIAKTNVASIISNSATNNALNIGAYGQLFDDGNFHIHSDKGPVWINALDGSTIRLGMQTNSGKSTVIVDTTTVGHSFFTKVQSDFNVAFGTEISMDNLKVRINGTGLSNGVVQAGAMSGTFTAYTTLVGNVSGFVLRGDTNSGGITFTTTYQNISSGQATLSSGGDTTTLHLIDITNSRIYRITAIHCQGTTGGYTSIERMA